MTGRPSRVRPIKLSDFGSTVRQKGARTGPETDYWVLTTTACMLSEEWKAVGRSDHPFSTQICKKKKPRQLFNFDFNHFFAPSRRTCSFAPYWAFRHFCLPDFLNYMQGLQASYKPPGLPHPDPSFCLPSTAFFCRAFSESSSSGPTACSFAIIVAKTTLFAFSPKKMITFFLQPACLDRWPSLSEPPSPNHSLYS